MKIRRRGFIYTIDETQSCCEIDDTEPRYKIDDAEPRYKMDDVPSPLQTTDDAITDDRIIDRDPVVVDEALRVSLSSKNGELDLSTFESRITIEDFVRLLGDPSFASSLYVQGRKTLERKRTFYTEEKKRIEGDVVLTRTNISRLRIDPKDVDRVFPLYYANIKAVLYLEDIIRIIDTRMHIEEADLVQELIDAVVDKKRGLASIVGQNHIKSAILKIVVSFAMGVTLEESFQNIFLLGRSGCGKTSTAKAIARVLGASGILATTNFYSYSPQDLIGEYVGWSAGKMRETLYRSLEGIWQLDEGYDLVTSSFGLQSQTELVYFLDRYVGKIFGIITGYAKKTAELFKSNEGMKRRFPTVLRFKKPTRSQLATIFSRALAARSPCVIMTDRQKSWFKREMIGRSFNGGDCVMIAYKVAVQIHSTLVGGNISEEISLAFWEKGWKGIIEIELKATEKHLSR